jgi:uncharacterized membrane protein YdbT with pleckstrin-like domain
VIGYVKGSWGMRNLQDVETGLVSQKLFTILRGHEAFAEISNEQLQEFVRRAELRHYKQGERVITQGETENNFFVIISGELEVKNNDDDPPRSLNFHGEGEIIGLRALLRGSPRAATVDAVMDSVVAAYGQEDWDWLIGYDHKIFDYFDKQERAFDQRAKRDFSGRQPDEVVVEAVKRHWIAFLATLIVPLGILFIPVLFLIGTEVMNIPLQAVISNWLISYGLIFLIVISFLITLYNFLDWRNDDLIVTTKRVIYIDRILFYAEERHEAPLVQIQNVATKSHGFFDRLLNVDDIIVNTAGTAPIVVQNVPAAERIGQIILAEQARAKNRIAAADTKSIRQLLEQRIKRDPTAIPQTSKGSLKTITPEPLLPTLPKMHLSYFVPKVQEFQDRKFGEKIEKRSVVWRKHYLLLLGKIILPLLALISSIALLVIFSWNWYIEIVVGLAALVSLGWYFWQYDDWQRDIYIATDTRIVDIESSPLGFKEDRREGSFDSIQDINYKIPNFFYKLINMGDVIIRTAGTGTPFTFEKVYNPSHVQEEIFNRWDKYQQQKKEKNRDDANKQIITVIGEYHDEFQYPD